MTLHNEYFLSFIEETLPAAALSAKKMEELIFDDPSSSIIKARIFAEEIINEVFKIEEIETPYQAKFYEKINILSRDGFITPEIQRSFDTIRMTGNKAAHNAAFNDITDAFKLHKEMFNIGVWFMEVYSSEQLKLPIYKVPKPPKQENIAELVNKHIIDLLGSNIFDNLSKGKNTEVNIGNTGEKEEDEQEENINISSPIITKDLNSGESYLIRELKRLKESSQEAIENASQFSDFKDYLHVDRKIQIDLENILEKNKNKTGPSLILLCGSVGDGKSHLLAYLTKKNPQLIGGYKIFNDATESFSPNKNALETLEENLKGFSDELFNSSNDKVILAINMGVLHNFINTEHKQYHYQQLKKFVEDSELFSQNITTHFSDNIFDLLSFGDYHSYELTEKGTISTFYSALIEKIVSSSGDNPFYQALLEDQNNSVETMAHQNYLLLQNKFVQEQIVQLVIQTIVKKKLVISARAFLNFIADILIPDILHPVSVLNDFDKLNYSLPNLLFNRKERSFILDSINKIDPIHKRSTIIDGLIIELNTLNDWNNRLGDYIKDKIAGEWLQPFLSKSNVTEHSFTLFFESFIRITYLTNQDFANNIKEETYTNYLKNLYYFNSGEKRKIKAFYEEIRSALFKWKGSPKKDYIYLDKPTDKYRLAQKLELKPTIEHLVPNMNEVLSTFKSSILLAYHGGDSSDKIYLEIDYPLYELLAKVQQGYRPNKKDEEDAIKFIEFIEKIMSFGDKQKELLIYFPRDNRFYTLKRDSFDAFVFERE
ncbi:DNA phosphorothioation-dependent restriction protein DptF [Bacillus sp. EB01]|uniref:DNA phosphorothioation-dependent restriction protein DptF n=1 Tax=Bacillus sp. EB01 TaxID=1347086 RepID=UPI000B15D10C|nr:DNA phosphorothioation-dependent restriction protein DptF [Bacillus sp. EB01]